MRIDFDRIKNIEMIITAREIDAQVIVPVEKRELPVPMLRLTLVSAAAVSASASAWA